MLKKLRRKMLLINMFLVSIVLLIAMTTVYAALANASASEFYHTLRREIHAEDRDAPPMTLGEKTDPPVNLPLIPHIRATLNEDGAWDVQHSRYVTIDSDSLVQALSRIQHAEADEGMLLNLHMGYVRADTADGTTVILGDTSTVRIELWNAFLICTAVSLCSLFILFFVCLWLSHVALKPAEETLKKQTQFIADASHELKTPLTVILANNRIMSDHPDETVRQQDQWLSSTREEAEQMKRLIDEMLTLLRTDTNPAPVSLQPVDASALIEEELLYLEPVAYEKQVPLVTYLMPDLILQTDPTLLKKLLVILVDNAVKYGVSGQPVTITLTRGKTVCLCVHNYGPVIPPEDLPHLFDRFYRSDKSRSTEGYGLGLSIAHSIARRLKASLSVASTEEAGTTFTVEFKN